MNRLSIEDRARIVACLCEGMSMSATVRTTGFAKKTVERTLREVGEAVWLYQIDQFVDLQCKRLEPDEIWSFCYAKARNVPEEKRGTFGYGDVWTWTALDADSKLVPCWTVGPRDEPTADDFVTDLAHRIGKHHRVQISTDGLGMYMNPIKREFGSRADYGLIIKKYGKPTGKGKGKDQPTTRAERKYSPEECTSSEKHVITGEPNFELISTSYIERQNLTMRMSMRRYTRLTNAFSKKLASHEFALALYFMHYNYCRPHKTLGPKTTPALAAGLALHVWSIEEITALAEPKITALA